jgi:hypothetical protein
MAQWRAIVNIKINFRVPQNAENFLISKGSFSFCGLRSMDKQNYARGPEYLPSTFLYFKNCQMIRHWISDTDTSKHGKQHYYLFGENVLRSLTQ